MALRVRSLFVKTDWGLPCLVPLLTWLHVSDYRNFWNTERWYTVKNYSLFYSVLLLDHYSERLFPQFALNYCYFFTFILVKYCVFYSVKFKMLRYIVKNIVKYRDFFNRQIRASILPTKYYKFVFFTVNL